MHWSVKLIMGLGIIGAVSYLLPIFDLFEMFLYVVAVPILVLYALGMVGYGTVEAVQNFGPALKNDLTARVEAYKAVMEAEAERKTAY